LGEGEKGGGSGSDKCVYGAIAVIAEMVNRQSIRYSRVVVLAAVPRA